MSKIILKVAILFFISAHAFAAPGDERRAEHERAEQERLEQEWLRVEQAQRESASPGERSMQAGVCAVYLESLKVDKKWTDRAWKLAPDIRLARRAANEWQRGVTSASGTMKESYAHEGERDCMAINALPGNTK